MQSTTKYVEFTEEELKTMSLSTINSLLPIKVTDCKFSKDITDYVKAIEGPDTKPHTIIDEKDVSCIVSDTLKAYIIYIPCQRFIYERISDALCASEMLPELLNNNSTRYMKFMQEAEEIAKLEEVLTNSILNSNHIIVRNYREFYCNEVKEIIYTILERYTNILHVTKEIN